MICATPAPDARAITASTSPRNFASARWQCVSIIVVIEIERGFRRARGSAAGFLVDAGEQRRGRIYAMPRLDAIPVRRAREFLIDVKQAENLFRRYRHERLERV